MASSSSAAAVAAATTKQLRFQGKKALVLGGTSGIGLASCRMLVEEGANVIAYSRSADKCQAAIDYITTSTTSSTSSAGGSFTACPLDILDRDAVQKAFETNTGFDYLVACATGGSRALGPFLDMDMDGFQGSFAKLWGYANAVRYGAHHMNTSNTTGSSTSTSAIVLVSGSPARKCKPGYVALSCVGGAVENLVRALATELSAKQIRINCVSPGMIDTPMFDGKGDQKAAFLQQATSQNPVPRAGTPDEVAKGILFALENDFVTGTIIDVDGGATVP